MTYADAHACVVTTKDADFVDAFYLRGTPQKLWLLSTGNIKNQELDALIHTNLEQIVALFAAHQFIELSRTSIIIHI
jgi:predicted nuclease of predicted toxin-antitoxin system